MPFVKLPRIVAATLLGRGSLLTGLCGIALSWGACGPEFTVGPNDPREDASVDAQRDAAGGRAGNAGASGNAGRSGSAGSAGSAGNAGASGADGGAPCTTDSCGASNYCNTDSGKCAACSDVSRFRFATPETFTVADASLSERFPRTTATAGEMLFRLGNDGTEHALALTPNFSSTAGWLPFGTGVDLIGQAESGPLQTQIAASFGQLPNFYFDRTVGGPGGRRLLYGGTRTTGPMVTAVQAMGAVVNESTSSNYSIAVAGEAGRIWWMSSRSNPPVLLTTALPSSAAPPAVVSIKLGAAACSRGGTDSTPWAAPDGSFLLLSALETDSACTAQGNVRDLFVVVMQPSGQPVQSAISLMDVNKAAVDDTDPTLSADLCSLYFASNAGASPTIFRLYRARRR